MVRIVIYPKDIVRLTNKSESYARKEIQRIKIALKKHSYQHLTIKEYCEYYAFDLNEVNAVLDKFERNNP
ncbi:hypothetical protein ACSV4D_12630 [Flavobacterium sp. ARAG 55.4]|uniref:hypothetical protein n=1 Tax=Flavobacterium sp. ARAG 55.4 TaxID=3451357 RepID=UPI003F47AA0E